MKQAKTLKPIRPSAAIEANYQKKLDDLIAEMQRSIIWWISAAYRADTPVLAQDASPAATLRAVMRRLARYWNRRFDKAAPEMAKYFATAVSKRTDNTMKSILKDAGFSVEFKMTAAANDVFQSTLGAQVSLIKSIAQQHLTDVEGAVMRSVQVGGDLGTLTNQLESAYGVTRRRAALIAIDQNRKATASITKVRQMECGITKAIWVHSHGGKEPRPSHLKAGSEKLVYEISKGAYLDGKWTWPGVEINCRCVSRPIIPALSG